MIIDIKKYLLSCTESPKFERNVFLQLYIPEILNSCVLRLFILPQGHVKKVICPKIPKSQRRLLKNG